MNENLDLQKSLEYIGFSQKEVSVYLALLLLGRGTVTEISKKSRINRPTGYHILSSLESKGLVKASGKEPKQEYVAESPDQIEKLLVKKIEEDQKYIAEARKIIPELKSIHNVVDRPKVFFYEGEEGLQKVYENTLTSEGEILAYASVEDVESTLPHYFPEYYKRRTKKGITIRAIFPESAGARHRASLDKEEIRETLLVPKEKFGFHPEINIYNNKVMIASWREKLGIIIESTEIADAMKKIYELSWAEAKRLNENS
jgi:HTH-type transcriptional regulator, sugar sensing transcriptional regulator